MGLLHLQQNVDIPEIQLTAHPSVQHIIRSCEEQGRRARVQDMGSKEFGFICVKFYKDLNFGVK